MVKGIDITPLVDYALGFYFLAHALRGDERARDIFTSSAYADWIKRCEKRKELAHERLSDK